MTDLELMQNIGQGSEDALTELYRRYGGPIYGLALRIVETPSSAEEVTQDVFMRVWEQSLRWDSSKGTLVGWLMQIARFRAIDYVRYEKRRPTSAEVELDDLPIAIAEPLWEDGQILREFMQQLPKEQGEALYLAFFKGMTHSQIAEATGLPLGTVKTRLRLGLQKLKELWLQTTTEL
jgi:RNA polymerase sigma-70 factor, ECF subfamily